MDLYLRACIYVWTPLPSSLPKKKIKALKEVGCDLVGFKPMSALMPHYNLRCPPPPPPAPAVVAGRKEGRKDRGAEKIKERIESVDG
jgi:hypothetical protein